VAAITAAVAMAERKKIRWDKTCRLT